MHDTNLVDLVHATKTRMAVPRYIEVPVDRPALDLYTNFTTMDLDLRLHTY
eukprot:SAG11_NODE_3237_length_2590_cov_1.560418_2_plen_51_part_00